MDMCTSLREFRAEARRLERVWHVSSNRWNHGHVYSTVPMRITLYIQIQYNSTFKWTHTHTHRYTCINIYYMHIYMCVQMHTRKRLLERSHMCTELFHIHRQASHIQCEDIHLVLVSPEMLMTELISMNSSVRALIFCRHSVPSIQGKGV